MRQIKLKFWDNDAKEWINSSEMEFEGGKVAIPFSLYSKNFESCQFTGLTDKNEKEIFEGNICQVKDSDGFNEFGEIIWGKYSDDEYVENLECWIFKQKHGGSPLSCVVNYGVKYSRGLATTPNTLEIIGNIYENPELLNQN